MVGILSFVAEFLEIRIFKKISDKKFTKEAHKMELRVLKYFLIAAREENITKAAQLLHVTQPTLSRQFMQLEEELGVKLFERSNHKIILTNDGLLLKRRAQELVALAEKTQKELSGERVLGGELEIGSGEFKSFSLISDIIAQFTLQNPSVSFKLYSGNADNTKEKLESGILDMGVLAEPVDISKYEFLRMPIKETWGILVHKDFEISAKKLVTPDDLKGYPIIMPYRRLMQNEIISWFGDAYDSERVFAIYDLLYNAAVMVRKKMGIVLTIDLESRYKDLKFIPLSPKLELGTVLVWKKNQIKSADAEAFIDFAKKYVKRISNNTK